MKLENATQYPRRYFGLHMVEGVAEYSHLSKPNDPYRILALENAIKEMDSSFEGLPVYVDHVNEVILGQLEKEMVGVVVRSFFNKADGKHWCEFMVTSDKGHEAISSGWKLSNAYVVTMKAGSGEWHAVPYKEELIKGRYDHLAIVRNPRYAESIILTPEQFKKYNDEKETALQRLSNSKTVKEKKSMFDLFKKEKVQNSDFNIDECSVKLPQSGIEVGIKQLILNADKEEMGKDKPKFANGEDKVKIGEEEMSVNSLVEKYNSFAKKKNEEDEEKKKNEAEEEVKKNKKKNEDEEEAKKNKKKNEDEEEEKKKNSLENFHKLMNANGGQGGEQKAETMQTQIARGKERY